MSYSLDYNIKNKIDEKTNNETSKDIFLRFTKYLENINIDKKPITVKLEKQDSSLIRYNMYFVLNGLETRLSPDEFKRTLDDVSSMIKHPYLELLTHDKGYSKTGWIVSTSNLNSRNEENSNYKTLVHIRTKDTFSTVNSNYNDNITDINNNDSLKYAVPISRYNVFKTSQIIREIRNNTNINLDYYMINKYDN